MSQPVMFVSTYRSIANMNGADERVLSRYFAHSTPSGGSLLSLPHGRLTLTTADEKLVTSEPPFSIPATNRTAGLGHTAGTTAPNRSGPNMACGSPGQGYRSGHAD